ncbi:LysR family transcriptional regulator [Chromobacterium sp. IIBBL 290-4]|uniref:LysR family transcriptional regulator n=1 Tax=Chromobacterium sp. IIBBL 290-4 TaxID=2953890 RepID=UPI0020B8041D|nr:LysR family transcriptional regulator [Chromobacterium sp. IIBBL 290-4]UTH74366.1 LysR family transcriptional regulator [Chromobacterium sp. IIBBL 290-4]
MNTVHYFQHEMNNIHDSLRGLDLNLLRVFDALYRRRSVQSAADALAISPSACSHALSRLRDAVGDELFLRTGREMRPTERARRLSAVVEQALSLLADGLRQGLDFDPGSSDRLFTLAATDYTALAVLPALWESLGRVAPRLRFRVLQTGQKVPLEELLAGSIDFALGYSEQGGSTPEGVDEFDWLEDEYVAAASAHHPRIGETLPLDAYLAERHAVVTPWNEPRGVVDHVLEQLGLARDVALQLPSVLAAPFIIGRSELIMTLPGRAARILAEAAGIRLLPPPFAIPPYQLKIYSHQRHAGDAAHQWVKRQLLACR